jgi:hypothetical protein
MGGEGRGEERRGGEMGIGRVRVVVVVVRRGRRVCVWRVWCRIGAPLVRRSPTVKIPHS